MANSFCEYFLPVLSWSTYFLTEPNPNTMDSNLSLFLKSLKLDYLLEHFYEQNVTMELLQVINETELQELVPKIGDRIKIKTQLKKCSDDPLHFFPGSKSVSTASTVLLNNEDTSSYTEIHCDNGIDVLVDNKSFEIQPSSSSVEQPIEQAVINIGPNISPGDSSPPIVENPEKDETQAVGTHKKTCHSNFFLHSISLKQFLSNSSKGRAILESYDCNPGFGPSDRRYLVELLIDGILDRHDTVKRCMLEDLADDIVELFPLESKDTYYQYNKASSKNARGKLIDKYKNERAYRQRFRKTKNAIQKEPETHRVTKDCGESHDKMVWLRHNYEPWHMVQSNWVATFSLRSEDLKSTMLLQDILQRWPLLKNPLGYSLVS